MKPVALIILDGWGLSENPAGNAVFKAHPEYFNHLWNTEKTTSLSASGLDVGLPDGQMGNSEVGHLNIGAGRVIYQVLTQVAKDIEEDVLYHNETLQQAFKDAKGRKLHFVGLVSDGGIHSHIDQLKALLSYAKRAGVEDAYVHAITDGRDTLPESGKGYIEALELTMNTLGIGKVATVSGRYYAMDRDRRWERTKLAYDAMVFGDAPEVDSASEGIQKSYDEGVTDEFIKPMLVDEHGLIEEGDVIFFFNFRPDRARQLTMAFSQKGFEEFPIKTLKPKYYCMTQYDSEYTDVHIIYPPKVIKNTLAEWLSVHHQKQFHIAETEKYAHVTFFFNGGVEEPFEGEDRVLVASPKVATYDLKPEMSAYEVRDEMVKAVGKKEHLFYLLNFANPDMVGHTGDIEAASKAVHTVDECLKDVVEALLDRGADVIITADHGNAEQMLDEKGEVLTQHSTNLVPFIVITKEEVGLVSGGRLADIAPTILELMGLEKPEEMTGESLLRR